MMDYVELISVSLIDCITFINKLSNFTYIIYTEIGQLYAIAGNSHKVNLCQYVKEYSLMSITEKRGIAGAYKKGCACEVSRQLNQYSLHFNKMNIYYFRSICALEMEVVNHHQTVVNGHPTTIVILTMVFVFQQKLSATVRFTKQINAAGKRAPII